MSLAPASNLCAFHLFYGFFSASLHVFNPVFFFDRCRQSVQMLFGLRLCRFTVESCYHCPLLFFHVRDSVVELHVPVIFTFFHFYDG